MYIIEAQKVQNSKYVQTFTEYFRCENINDIHPKLLGYYQCFYYGIDENKLHYFPNRRFLFAQTYDKVSYGIKVRYFYVTYEPNKGKDKMYTEYYFFSSENMHYSYTASLGHLTLNCYPNRLHTDNANLEVTTLYFNSALELFTHMSNIANLSDWKLQYV